VLQDAFQHREYQYIGAKNTVGYGKGQATAYKAEEVEHLLAQFAIKKRKQGNQNPAQIAWIHRSPVDKGISFDEQVDQPPADLKDKLKDADSQ